MTTRPSDATRNRSSSGLEATGEKSAKTVPSADGLLVVDYAKDGKPIGVEITAPTAVPLDRLNRLLADLGETPLNEHDDLPVRAA